MARRTVPLVIALLLLLLATPSYAWSKRARRTAPTPPPTPSPTTGCATTCKTLSQGGWGQTCNSNPNSNGCLLETSFTTLYPSGLTIGCTATGNKILFTSAFAVENALPSTGPPAALTTSYTNPASSGSGGTLKGQLATAKLNGNCRDDARASVCCRSCWPRCSSCPT